jgi:hypothetical protein
MERGCSFLADDSNMYFRHVEQIASYEERQAHMHRCPVDYGRGWTAVAGRRSRWSWLSWMGRAIQEHALDDRR